MRLNFRNVLVGIFASALVVSPLSANHYTADCPVSLVGQTAPASEFSPSPHAAFRNGSSIYLLRGETLTTLNLTDTGEVTVGRQDRVAELRGLETGGGVAYQNGYLYVTSAEAGLEIFDLRSTHGGSTGIAPVFLSRTSVPHYTRVAVDGNLLAALYPANDLPCAAVGTNFCFNYIDIYNISDPASPVLASRITSNRTSFVGFNDVAFANGFLYATGLGGTFAFNLADASLPTTVQSIGVRGDFLATNGTDLLAIGQQSQIAVMIVGPGSKLTVRNVYTLPSILNHSNDLMFHPEAAFDDNGHLITMIDERDPMTLQSARTIAFDIFDMNIQQYEGFDDRIYENVSYISPDEVKYDPVAVGPFIYVNGEISGAQTYGACGMMAGRLEFDNLGSLPCGGAELHGYVTGVNKIENVELFLDGSSLGIAHLTRTRTDIVSSMPVTGFAATVNLDQVAKGDHLIRVVATDRAGNTRQIFSKSYYFAGPGSNCSTRRRTVR
jgi:hypothetical protein